MGKRKPSCEYRKKVHPSKKRKRRLKNNVAVEKPKPIVYVNNSKLHKCTQCEKKFKTFEDIKNHFLETHTKWKKDESSVEGRQTNVSIEKEPISSETKANNELTPTVNEKEDGNSSHHHLGQKTHSKPRSKSETHKVEIIFECELKNCGKSFKNFGDLEIHKKTQHVDKSSKRCTKCDAEFDSFEILKQHFLQTHTKWKKEDESNESKDDEDVVIVEKNAKDPKNDFIKENFNNNCTKIILNSKKVDKCLQVNTITTDTNVQGFLTVNTGETIIDDPKNTFVIFSENAIVDTNNTAFYIVKTKPSAQNDLLFELLSNNKESYVAKDLNKASCFSSFSENITSDPKPTADFCQNFITDLRNSKTNVTPLVKPTPKVVCYRPYERNTTSSVSNEIPVEKDIILDEPMDLPVEIKNTSSDVANTTPKVKNTTSDVANTMPDVSKITSMIENFLPVMRNIKSIPIVKPALKTARLIGKVSKKICYCFNCLSGANDGLNQVMVHMCSECGKEFIDKFQYYSHIRKHDPIRIYHCPLSCGERFNRPGKMINHVYLHNRWKSNVCQICKKRFKTESHLERHSDVYHNRKSPEIRVNYDSDSNEISDENNLEVQLTNGNTEIANQASSLSIGSPSGGAESTLQQLGTPTTISSSNVPYRDFSSPTDLLISDLISQGYSGHGSYKNNQTYPKEKDTVDITNDISEVEDNNANPITEISDEDYSSEEDTMNDITNAPGLVEDEVCLELGENFGNNIPPDPLSVFEQKPIPQTILNKEESVGAIPEILTNLNAENMEFDFSVQTEQSIKPVLYHIVNIEESVECMSLMEIKSENEMKTMEERTESFPNQIVNIDEESMECTPLARVKREVECIEPVPEQMINTEESIEFTPTKRIKREVEINLVPGQRIHVADAKFVMRSFNGNRYLRVDLERLPFFI